MSNINEDFDSKLADNSKNTDDRKDDGRATTQSSQKLKNIKVKDGISKGRTMTGSKPDKIEINPVIEAAEKTAVIGMARMNPPTVGHHKFIKKIEHEAEKAGGSAHVILSHSEGDTKNPLPLDKKKELVQKLVQPSTHVETTSKEAPSMLHQAARIHQHAHHLVIVGSSGKGDQDRANQFHQLLTKYNGVHGPHGYFNFKSIKKVSSGSRDPDAGGMEGMSGTKMREHANNANVREFKKGLPKELHPHAEEMMKAIQKVKAVEPIKKKKLKEEIFDAFEKEMDISESGLKSLKEKSFKSGVAFDTIFEQYVLGYIDNLLVGSKMTNEQAGFASVNSFIANALFESGVPFNTASGGFIRGMGYVSGNPDGDSEGYLTTNVGDADTQNNIMKLMKQVNHDRLHANFKTEQVDLNAMFEDATIEKYGKNREVLSRSGQQRKDIDNTTRKGEDRKTDDRPYRNQSVKKQIVDEAFEQALEEGKRGLWDNIHAKQKRIKAGSGEHMRKAGEKGRPTKADFIRSQSEEVNHMFEDYYGSVVPNPTPHDRPTMVKKKKSDVKEMSVPAGTSGKRKTWNPPMVGIRMASGKIEKHPPGKSGSSGGGGNGGE